jgi:hypothetical protein
MGLTTESGATRFARYAFPPNELGYCGPDDASVLLLQHATDGRSTLEVAARARQFEGAWAYLSALRDATGLEPLDPLVVEAYWVGNDLLGKVDPQALLEGLRCRLRSQTGGLLGRVVPSPDVLANHGFHVFAVYPWSSMLGGSSDVPRSVLDACRIRWGTVESVDAERAQVVSQPLEWDGSRLRLGAPRQETVRWSAEGLSLAATPVPGGVVSMHWDWICERLTPDRTDALADSTAHALDMANAIL